MKMNSRKMTEIKIRNQKTFSFFYSEGRTNSSRMHRCQGVCGGRFPSVTRYKKVDFLYAALHALIEFR